jgi:hypothetical protein
MGWLDRVKGSYEAGKIQQRHAEERAYRKKLADQQKSRQDAMHKPNKAAAFAGRVAASKVGTFGKKAAAATETAGKAGLNWVMTGNTEGKRRTSAPSTTTPRRKRTSSTGTTTRVVYVAANPPKPKRRKPKKDYWDNPPF